MTIKTLFQSVFAVFTLLILHISNASFAAEETASIENLMTAEQLRATGVSSLNALQKAELSKWLADYLSGATPDITENSTTPIQATPQESQVNVATESTQTPPAQVQEPESMPSWRQRREKVDFESKIVGNFTGWEGATLFRLENGQVWQQRRGRRWKVNLQDPAVRIYQNFMGAYEMEVLSEGRSIGVKRLR